MHGVLYGMMIMTIHKHFVKNITSRAKNLAITVQILLAISLTIA